MSIRGTIFRNKNLHNLNLITHVTALCIHVTRVKTEPWRGRECLILRPCLWFVYRPFMVFFSSDFFSMRKPEFVSPLFPIFEQEIHYSRKGGGVVSWEAFLGEFYLPFHIHNIIALFTLSPLSIIFAIFAWKQFRPFVALSYQSSDWFLVGDKSLNIIGIAALVLV